MKKIPALVAGAFILSACQDDTFVAGPGSPEQSQLLHAPASLSCEAPPDGLIGWWRGADDPGTEDDPGTVAEDVVGANDGTLIGNASFGTGMVGQGFVFNGGWIEIPDDESLDLTGELSLEFWFHSGQGGSWRGLVAKRAEPPASGLANYGVNYNESSFWGLGAYYNDPAVAGEGDDGYAFEAVRVPMPLASAFHHVAVTYRQVDLMVELRMFIDGHDVRTIQVTGDLASTVNDAPLTIGSWFPGGELFTGIVDEVSIYDQALDPVDIDAIYNAGSFGKCTVAEEDPDTTPPTIDLSLIATELWPANHEMRLVASGISATDDIDPATTVYVSVASNEPITSDDDDTTPDWVVEDNGDGTYNVSVRAERHGEGNGRVYTITVVASDASGNTAATSAEVRVPHNGVNGRVRGRGRGRR